MLYALTESGADAVLARWMISRKTLNGRPVLFTVIFFLAATLMGALASALGAYLFSIAMVDSIAKTVGYDNKSQWKKAMYTGSIVCASVGGGIIVQGHGHDDLQPHGTGIVEAGLQIDQVSCWLTYTNEKTHEIIRNNLGRSPIYAGIIEGTGPRYCPSIEDKVVKFADKDRHQIFIEPEGLHTNEMYVGGMSSSLPEDVQHEMYRTLPGLEHVKIVRNAYAIEYDAIDPLQCYPTLENKLVENLYTAGQINGRADMKRRPHRAHRRHQRCFAPAGQRSARAAPRRGIYRRHDR